MFNSRGRRIIVRSTGIALYQHDCFTWQVYSKGAIAVRRLTSAGEKNKKSFDALIMKMSIAERREFVEVFFDVVAHTGAKTLLELTESKFQSATRLVKGFASLDNKKKALMYMFLMKIIESI